MQQGIVIHAPHDLRVQELETGALQPQQLKVKVKAGGICGSDLHYYHHGGFGTVRIKEPMVLGHEVSGVIAEAGSGITDIAPGTRTFVSARVCRAAVASTVRKANRITVWICAFTAAPCACRTYKARSVRKS